MKSSGNPGADRLELLQTFVRIVEAGSLSAAAEQLGTTQPTISRRLQALERAMGLRLLQRSTHGIKLTDDGERCYLQGREVLEGWNMMEAQLRAGKDEPEGYLRVIAPHAFGQEHLIGPLTDYLRQYPRVQVEWLLHDRRPDFVADAVDCAIQVGTVDDPSVIAVHLAEVPRIVAAAPEVLADHGRIRHASELAHLPWVALRTYYRNEVSLIRKGTNDTALFPIRPSLITDSLYALRSGMLAGLGAGLASAWVLEKDIESGRLIHVAPEWSGASLPVYLVYPYARFYPARLRMFLEAMKTALPASLGLRAGPK